MGILLGCVLSLTAAKAVAQKPRAVVMEFTARGGAKARIQVIRALRDRVAFEKQDAAERVLASRGLEVSSKAGRAAVAEELNLDYVIWGRVRGKGSSARAEIRFAGPDGKQIATKKAGPPGQSKGNARIQKAARAAFAAALAAYPPSKRRAKAAAEPAAAPPPAAPAEEPTAATAAAVSAAEIDEPVQIKLSTEKTRYAPIFILLGGAGGRVRKIDINVDDGAGGTATRSYDSGIYLDIVFRLELRPWARSATKGLRGLALEADGDFAVGLETETQGSNIKLDTKAWRVLGQLGYIHTIRKHEIGGLIGFGVDRLEIQANGTLPSLRYLFFRFGPAYRVHLVEKLLYLRVDGGFRLPISYGELEDAFGSAKGFGFDAGLMLGGQIDVGFSYALRVSADFFKPQFSGFPPGELPPLPAAAQGRDGTDVAINFHVMIGWAY